MAITAADVYRDFVTDGVPSSGEWDPKKPEIRQLLNGYEQIIKAFTSNGGLIYSSLAALNADLSKPANSMAWVMGDPIAANNGVYGKVGAPGAGSWTRRADLPFSFIIASDAGAGTPNAIQATTAIPVSGSALVWMNVAQANTGSPVTVSFNGGAPLTIKTNSGNNVVAGGLVAGMIVLGIVSGTAFRILSDQVSSAIIAAAEAAAAMAIAAAAGVNLPPVAANRMLIDNAAGTTRESRTFPQVRDVLGIPTMASFGAAGDAIVDDSTAVASAVTSGRLIDGEGKTYKVSTKPFSFKNIKNAAFKVGNVIHPSRDFLRTDTAKITNGMMYTAWAQDKAYKVDTQLRVWVNEKESHGDGTGRIALYVSDDGGSTFSFGEYLEIRASGNTLWSAGYDGTNEFLLVRLPTGSTDVPPYTYQLWKRALGTGDTRNYNGPWTKTNITFPMPSWAVNAQPIMIHSFCVGHGGSICVGGSLGNGTGIYRSTNGGTTWTFHQIQEGESTSEPTVRYVASLGMYCGFVRRGDGNPRWWVSTDNLATVSQWTAPATFFGPTQLEASTVSFDIDPSGNFHAVAAYRNGVIEGAGTDERVSTFYLTGPVIPASIWTASTTRLYCLAQVSRSEQGGSSALGQGAVIATAGKVHLYYGMEGRTGVSGGVAKGNRIMDIVQTTVWLDDYGSAYDTRADLYQNRAAYSPLRKVSGLDAFVIPFTDTANWSPGVILSGRPNFYRNLTTTTIAADAINLTGTRSGFYIIDTEGGAATDNLSTITDVNAQEGDVIVLATSSGARDITIKHNVGNIICGSDRVLDSAFDKISLMFFNGNWHMMSFADNGT